MPSKWSLKLAFLRAVIVALVASAVGGIYTCLVGEFGEIEAKMLLTTLSVSYFSVTSLACAAAIASTSDLVPTVTTWPFTAWPIRTCRSQKLIAWQTRWRSDFGLEYRASARCLSTWSQGT